MGFEKLNTDIMSGDDCDFFISYSSSDKDTVKKIVEVLENIYHIKCWFQDKDSRADYVDEITRAIESAKAFLVFISPNSAKSANVKNEVHHAAQWNEEHEDYTVLPIVLDQNDTKLTSTVYKWFNFNLGRFNRLEYDSSDSIDALVLKILEQAKIEIIDDAVRTSLYHHTDSEAKRLKAQNEVMLEFSRELLDKTITSDSIVLDIGCSDGQYIMMQLEKRQYKCMLGIDIDESQIALANEKYGSEKNTFIACDALSEDFDDILSDYLDDHDARSFDVITITALILHIDKPVELLKTLKRFLGRTGRIIIQEEDDGANVVHPSSRFYDLAFRIWADSKESGDRHCARKIPDYLKKAGYSKMTLSKCGISNVGMSDEHKAALWDIYFNYNLWLAADEGIFYHLSETMKKLEEYKGMYEKYKEQYDKGETFVQLGFYLFTAGK